VLVALQLALLITWISNPSTATRASIPSAALSFVDSLAILALTGFGHARHIRPLSSLTLYLLFSVLFNAVELRTLYLRSELSSILGLSTAVLGVKLVLLLLETRNKRSYLRNPYRNYSPEATSGLINRGLFWWLNPLITSGFRKILSLDDLYVVDPELLSEPLQKRMVDAWNKCIYDTL
jgi:ATP-binding cassette, subfamily C (CFTR/MRP), member 1